MFSSLCHAKNVNNKYGEFDKRIQEDSVYSQERPDVLSEVLGEIF
jgi:hypothetical protein